MHPEFRATCILFQQVILQEIDDIGFHMFASTNPF